MPAESRKSDECPHCGKSLKIINSDSFPDLSIIIPIFCEEEILPELYSRLNMVMEKLKVSYEIIFVDDGSNDNSFKILKEFRARDEGVKIIKFSRNFGHHIAITAGLDRCRGKAVILMDGDLQDPPEGIPALYQKFQEGYDVVSIIPKTRKDPLLKKFFSGLFRSVFKKLTRIDLSLESGIYRILSRRVVDNIKTCREKSRFIIALIRWSGFPQAAISLDRDSRYAGKAKYNFFKSLELALDAITSFSYLPLRLSIYFGFCVAILSFLFGLFIFVKKIFFGMPVSGYASIIFSLFFFGGVQLLILGVIGEYLGRTYHETLNRPLYIVEETLGIPLDENNVMP